VGEEEAKCLARCQGPHGAEVSLVERGDVDGVQSLGEGHERGVGQSESVVGATSTSDSMQMLVFFITRQSATCHPPVIADHAADVAKLLGARMVIPLHFEGWADFTQGAGELKAALYGLSGERTRARRNFPICSVAAAASGVPSMSG